jgi:hypothetical protein
MPKGNQMAGNIARLGPKKERAISALLASRSIEDAARAAGIGARSLHRWLKDPTFQEAYRQAKLVVFAQSRAGLHRLTSAAISTLGKATLDRSWPPAVRVRAADIVLTQAAKAVEAEDFEARLEEIERWIEAQKTHDKYNWK